MIERDMGTFDRSAVKAILLDVYGTLFEIGDKRAPFRQLIQIGASQGRKPSAEDAAIIMGQAVGLQEAASVLGIRLSEEDRACLERDLAAEIASITPFADTLPALRELKSRDFKLDCVRIWHWTTPRQWYRNCHMRWMPMSGVSTRRQSNRTR